MGRFVELTLICEFKLKVWYTCLEKCGLSLQSLMSAAVLASRTLNGPCTSYLANM